MACYGADLSMIYIWHIFVVLCHKWQKKLRMCDVMLEINLVKIEGLFLFYLSTKFQDLLLFDGLGCWSKWANQTAFFKKNIAIRLCLHFPFDRVPVKAPQKTDWHENLREVRRDWPRRKTRRVEKQNLTLIR